MRHLNVFAALTIGAALAVSQPAAAWTFVGPLDRPAVASSLASQSPMMAVAAAGNRLVAVGQRGHIVYSDDRGSTWKQAEVPVSTDLVAVTFPSEKLGWAVGHGGVVLHSSDGGAHWVKQLDGKQSAELSVRYLEAQAATNPDAAVSVAREKRLQQDGGTQPLMAVFFENESKGYVVGSFNRIFRTQDGGKTWTPLMDRTDNPDELHFYSVVGDHQAVYVAGEGGMVLRFDAGKNRFVAHPLPYQGSVFGLLKLESDTVLAFGLRGSLFRSANGGGSWDKIALGTSAGITSGVVLPGGEVLLATQGGEVLRSTDQGKTFAAVKPAHSMSYYGIVGSPQGGIVLAGSEGVRVDPHLEQ
ncbi:MAG TPA: YCF48-related protein [Aromatoleum sp.]|uniref:WD40/YVTN/BNR-like repeat-containing protein n=1 Tax=Aromatoleum sp. TaxID=2307007 RepID=UPI002B4984B2|nr:YCF48-related protein [Aromatoleum sp.]HJV26467.1 YCF48-related protein [Aromatoleum sp.]